MNKITTWLAENKIMASLVAVFIVSTALLGWLAYTAWDDYGIAFAEYTEKSSQLAKLSQQKPFPNKANLTKLEKTVAQQKSELKTLVNELQRYTVPAFGNLGKVKLQDRPQQFQDALRNEVTRIKTLAANSGATLPPGFYLGMEEYENKPPGVEESLNLAKQLTVLSWLGDTLATKKGLIIAEFSRPGTETAASGSKRESARKAAAAAPTPNPTSPYETISNMRVSFRSNQSSLRELNKSSFRELINSLSSAPYFLLIEDIQLQNSSGEPPRRNAAPQAAEPTPIGGDAVQRLPIVVGRELLNVSMKARALEFPNSPQFTEANAK
ncbi:MAG: Amuc_1100 family pilus-like protein [Verrucomicrobia bacterium]|nr:Amuc_1100 family pilus-like protein [Verrucomicrobiota bacterium]